MATWTEETEEQLITLVEERPPLYNITLQCYSNRNKKDQLWREIESEYFLYTFCKMMLWVLHFVWNLFRWINVNGSWI